jgi:hypothetical protein
MAFEGVYLAVVCLLSPVAMFVFATDKLVGPLRLDPPAAKALALAGVAWTGGMLGGSAFSIKWYYHSIAKGKWHLDRRAWRVFTPLLSGALAFATLTLFRSDVLPIVDSAVTSSLSATAGLAFLIGYFSDNTVAALAAAADRLFGSRTALRNRDRSPD